MDGSPAAVAGSSAQSPSAAEIPAAPPSPAAEAAEALLAAATAENLTAGPSPAAEAADWGLTAAAALLRDAAAAEHNNLTVGVYEEIYRVLSSPTRARANSAPGRARWNAWMVRSDGALTVVRPGGTKLIAPSITWAFLVLVAALTSRKALARATSSAPTVICAVLDMWGIYVATNPGPVPFGAVSAVGCSRHARC